MAKVIITLEDKSETDVGITVEFEPEAKANEPATNAQSYALKLLENIDRDGGTRN